MRKIIVLAVSVVLLFAVGAFFVRRHLHVETDPAAFLPADTLIYVDQHQAEARGKRFLASPLGKAITAIDLPSLMRDLNAPMDAQVTVQNIIADFRELANNKITAELLGDRFALAMLPSRGPVQDSGVLPDMRGRLLLCCKPRHGAAAIDLLASVYSGDMETDTVPYRQYTLKRFKNEKFSFVACVVDGWLVAAFDESTIHESLDIFDAGKNCLAADGNFKKIAANLPQAQQITYLRLDALTQLAKDILSRVPDQAAAVHAGDLTALDGFGSFAYGGYMRDGILTERVLISLVPEKATAVVREILARPPRVDAFLPYLRDNLLFYSYSGVSNWLRLGDLPPETRVMVETFSGHSVEDLQKMLGDGESRLFVRKGEGGQSLPLPSINLCVAAAEPEKLSEIASSLLAQSGIHMIKGKFQDASYQVWSKAPEKNLRFYFALWRGQWCLGNSLDFFTEIAQPSPEEMSLLAAKDFKAVDVGIAQPVQSLLYIRMDQAFDLLHDIARFAATILAMQNRELSDRAKLVNQRVIFPILEAAKMYKRSFGRGVVESNLFKIDIKTSIVPSESQ